MQATPFQVHIPDEEIARLKRKLSDSRLPSEDLVEGAGWDYGMDLTWLKEMKEEWLKFDWRDAEKEINSFPNFKTSINGVDLHFVHAKSPRHDAVPIVLLHGWPSTFYEYYKIIEPLRNPEDPKQPAFHVVIPSIPGFGFSSCSRQKGWTVKDSGKLVHTLMTEVLEYKNYVAQGGDWGSLIATQLSTYPSCKLIHLNMCVAQPSHPILLGLLYILPSWLGFRRWLASCFFTDQDLKQLERSKKFAFSAGYFLTQAVEPLQIGLALNDNPIGLLVWIGSKYYEHIDHTKHNPEGIPFPTKELLTTLSIYFFTQSFASSVLPYYENSFKEPPPSLRNLNTNVKLGVSVFSHDILVMPKSWIEGFHGKKNLVFHRVHERGGHFPSLDNPKGLVDDLREFVSSNPLVD